MKQQIFKTIICSALLVILAACSEDDKSGKANIATPEDIQLQADAILDKDKLANSSVTVFGFAGSNGASNLVRKDVKGINLTNSQVLTGGKPTGDIMLGSTLVELKGKACPTSTNISAFTPSEDMFNSWVNIPNVGRATCINANCNFILLVLQLKRTVVSGNPNANGASGIQTSAVPVILRESDVPGTFEPTNSSATRSSRKGYYLVASAVNQGRVNCTASQTTTQGTPVDPGAGVNATNTYTPNTTTNNTIGYR